MPPDRGLSTGQAEANVTGGVGKSTGSPTGPPRSIRIEGTVGDRRGTPAEGATVHVVVLGTEQRGREDVSVPTSAYLGSATSEADGAFEFTDESPPSWVDNDVGVVLFARGATGEWFGGGHFGRTVAYGVESVSIDLVRQRVFEWTYTNEHGGEVGVVNGWRNVGPPNPNVQRLGVEVRSRTNDVPHWGTLRTGTLGLQVADADVEVSYPEGDPPSFQARWVPADERTRNFVGEAATRLDEAAGRPPIYAAMPDGFRRYERRPQGGNALTGEEIAKITMGILGHVSDVVGVVSDVWTLWEALPDGGDGQGPPTRRKGSADRPSPNVHDVASVGFGLDDRTSLSVVHRVPVVLGEDLDALDVAFRGDWLRWSDGKTNPIHGRLAHGVELDPRP